MSGEQLKKPEGNQKITRFQAENIAIHSLERAGFTQNDIYGDQEIKAAVEQFGKEHEGQTFNEAERAAIASFEEKEKSEFQKEKEAPGTEEVQQIAPIEVQGEVDHWGAAIDARKRGEKPKAFEELTPEQQKAVREAREEAYAATQEKMEERRREYGIPKPSEPERPDMELSQQLIAEKKEEAKRREEFAKRNPQLTPGTEEFRLAMRREQIGGIGGEVVSAEPETELALEEAKPAEEEPVDVAVAPKREEEIVPISEEGETMEFAPSEAIVQKEELSPAAKDFIAQELKKQGVDLQKDLREKYTELQGQYDAVRETDPEAAAKLSLEIAENATIGVEALREIEGTFKANEAFADQHTAFDAYVQRVRKSATKALEAAAYQRDRMGEESAVVAQAPKEETEEIMEFTPEEAGVVEEKPAEVAVAPTQEEVAPAAETGEIMDFTKEEEPEVAVAPAPEVEAPAPVVADEEAAEEVAAVSPENIGETAQVEEKREEAVVEEAEPAPGTPEYYAYKAKKGLEGGSQRRSGEREEAPKTDLSAMADKEVLNIVESKAGERPDMLRGNHDQNMAKLDTWMQSVASVATTLGVTQGELVNRYDLAKKNVPKAEPVAPAAAAAVAAVEEAPAKEEEVSTPPVTAAPKAEPEVAVAPVEEAEEEVAELAPEPAPAEEAAPVAVAPKEQTESLYEQGKKLSMGDFAPWYLSLSQEDKDQYNKEKTAAKAAAQEERKAVTPAIAAPEISADLAAQMEEARRGEVDHGEEKAMGPRGGSGGGVAEIGALRVKGGDKEIATGGPGEEKKVSLPPKRRAEEAAQVAFSLEWKPSEEETIPVDDLMVSEAWVLDNGTGSQKRELNLMYDKALTDAKRKLEVKEKAGISGDELQEAKDAVTYYQSAMDQIRKKL